MSDKRQEYEKKVSQQTARAPADGLWVELPPVRSDVFLQKYILHLQRYITSKDQKHKYENIYFAWATEDD